MPLPNLTVPAYPDVPFAPGVPPVARSVDFPPTVSPPTTFADGPVVNRATQAPKWGIYNKAGVRILTPDSVISFSFLNEYRISDYPVELGGFESYNKVATPFDARLVFTKGGTVADRKSFLDLLDAIIISLELFDVVTPEKAYINANIIRYDYERASRSGVSLLSVAIFLREIRAAAQTTLSSSRQPFANTQAPSGCDSVTTGAQQPQALSKDQESTIQKFRRQGLFH
jgi:hypothetical protein